MNQNYFAVKNPFLACKDYEPSKDDKYINCYNFTEEDDPCSYLNALHRTKEYRTVSLAIAPFILSSLTLIFNVIFIYLVIKTVFLYKKSSCKRYSFLISRAASTLITQLLFYVMLIIWKTGGLNYTVTVFLLMIGGVSVFTHAGTYIVVTFMLYSAVVWPIWYKTVILMKHCLASIGVIWMVSLFISIGLSIVLATLFYPESAGIHCEYYTCQFPVFFCFVIIVSISYFSVIFFYVFMFWRMKKRSAGKENGIALSRNMRTMKRLSFNLLVFSVWKLPLIIVGIISLAVLSDLRHLGYSEKSSCKTFNNAKLYLKAELVGSIALILWLLGLGMDPVVSILIDPPLWHYLKKKTRRVTSFFGSKLNLQKSSKRQQTVTEESSSGEF